MKTTKFVSTLSLVAGLALLALPASADHRSDRDGYRGGNDWGGQSGAVLYADSGFRGQAVQVDGAVPSLSKIGFNDRASSIDIRRGVWEVCVDANFQGRCEIINASTGQLSAYRLNDNISSLRPAGYDRAGTSDRKWGSSGQGLVLFPDSNQRGAAMEFSRDVSDLSEYRFNDKASSFIVSSGTWQVCEHANYAGRCTTLTVGAGDLKSIGMNDNISSIRRYSGWR